MRHRYVAGAYAIIGETAITLACEYLSARYATDHEFKSEEARRNWTAVVFAFGRFGWGQAFDVAVEDRFCGPRPQRVKPVCKSCGSDDIVRDACASWDADAQDWSLIGVFEPITCQGCEREGDFITRDVPIGHGQDNLIYPAECGPY